MEATSRILHLTDFHLRDPNGHQEHLRKDFYEEYLKDFLQLLQDHAGGPVSAIVVTGDFVDRGNAANFGHAGEIIEFIAKSCGLAPANVAVCAGNHDIAYDAESAGERDKAREAYRAFANNFANNTPIKQSTRATLCKVSENVWALMLDSTLGGTTIGGPGGLDDAEIDEIVTEFVAVVPEDDLLVVGTHFPVQTFPDSFVDYEEPGWTAKHVWTKAYPLKRRIAEKRQAGKTVWLCGDSHLPDECRIGAVYYVMTGRLGIAPGPDDAQVLRQAKLIVLPSDDETPAQAITFSFEIPGFEPQANYGIWRAEVREIRAVTSPASSTQLLSSKSTIRQSAGSPKSKEYVQLLSTQLEEQIIATVTRQKLYLLGRFTTSSERLVSLSWVSIGPLLNEPGMLPAVSDTMSRWLRETLGIGDSESAAPRCVLIGIDCWGAVLASQVSVLTGAENFCIGARSHGEHYTSSEKVGARMLAAVREASVVVFVTDVVVTGRSLELLYRDIVDKIRDFNPLRIEWLCLSLMTDGARPLLGDCGFIKAHYSACVSLPRPVLDVAALPNEDVLANTLALAGGA